MQRAMVKRLRQLNPTGLHDLCGDSQQGARSCCARPATLPPATFSACPDE